MAAEKKPAAEESTPSADAGKTVVVPPPKKGGNNKVLVIVLIVVFFVFVLPGILIGAGLWWFSRGDNVKNLTEGIIESAADQKVDINSDDGSFSVKSDDGSSFEYGTTSLPEGFPSSVPLYDNQDLTSSYRSSNEDSNVWSVTAETSDSSSKIDSYFDEKFAGWTNEGEFAANDMTTTSYRQGALSVTLSVGKSSVNEGKTNISYLVSEDK